MTEGSTRRVERALEEAKTIEGVVALPDEDDKG